MDKGSHFTTSLLPSQGSLLSSVYGDLKSMNPNTSTFQEQDKKKIEAPTYNPKVTFDDPPAQPQQTTQRAMEMPIRDQGFMGQFQSPGQGQGQPQNQQSSGQQGGNGQQYTEAQLTDIKTKFMWVLQNSETHQAIFTNKNTIERALSDPELMLSVILQFDKEIREKAERQEQLEKQNVNVDAPVVEQQSKNKLNFNDFRSVFSYVLYPLLTTLIFYILTCDSVVSTLQNKLSFIPASFNLLNPLVFFILCVLTKYFYEWLKEDSE